MPELGPRENEAGVARLAGAIEGGMKAAVQATSRRLDELPGSRVRRLRRLAHNPLPYLYEIHPEARRAIPHGLGTQTIAVEAIAGTAVGPPGQRGMDFLPPKPLRSANWRERWQRVRAASDHLAVLPPIDVQLFAGQYWVLDGHNRVATALYVGQADVDANVVELVAPGGSSLGTYTPVENAMEERSELQASLSRRTLDQGASGAAEGDHDPGRPTGTTRGERG